ncbi:MAG: phosphoglucosamine mutase [Candidatus Aminicenantes bacterium]|nr:phosphoglucosamine mutase [Candidatus Aminicenantes bacterium]
MEKLFGTDGIRGVAGEYPLDYSSVYALGKALISLLQAKGLEPKVLIGRDTRESGVWLEEALFAGIREKKGEAVTAGIIPTSAISFLTKKYSFSAGIVISASHNPYHDNGIKVFSSEGMKISDKWEEQLEKAVSSANKTSQKEKAEILLHPAFRRDYVDFLESQFSPEKLHRNIKVVLDCANGASFSIAPQVFSDLGLEVTTLNNSPDGRNINENCGSLYPQYLSRKVIETQADLGIAFDGDADRAVWVDEKGNVLNGDHTLFVLSRFMREKGRLRSNNIVATTMSNMGLENALEKLGLKLIRTQVGDKYVLEEMIKIKANLGGEQSGHTIFLDDCPTGDGILTSVKWLEAMAEFNLPASRLVDDFDEYPQVLRNVRVRKKTDFNQFPEIVKTIENIKSQLETSGRMEVRFSGTEPMARIMIEGKDKTLLEQYCQEMATIIHKYLGN